MANFFDNRARAAAGGSSSSSKPKPTETVTLAPRLQPWVEKYRPKTLDEVKSQEHATNTLRRMVNASNLPHLLLYGPPGTGKTSTILALSRELFGPELFSSRVLELNASDERGITVIRERVKSFAQQALMHAPTSKAYREKYPCPPFKIIILDEADSLTQDAQGALRRTMEIYSKITRICLCCNYVTRIIDPISSRCSKFRFKSLEGSQAADRIRDILAAENVAYEDAVVDRVLKISEGDLRKALQLLQSAARLVGATSSTNGHSTTQKSKKSRTVETDSDEEMTDAADSGVSTKKSSPKITTAIIDEISGVFPPSMTDSLIKVMRKGATSNYTRLATEIEDIIASGYAGNEVLGSLYSRIILGDTELVDSKKKNQLCLVFSEMDKRLVDGVDEHLLLLDLACRIAVVLSAK